MRLPCFAENGPDAGRTGLGHLDENAFVFVGDHIQWLANLSCYLRLARQRAGRKWVGRDSNPEPTP